MKVTVELNDTDEINAVLSALANMPDDEEEDTTSEGTGTQAVIDAVPRDVRDHMKERVNLAHLHGLRTSPASDGPYLYVRDPSRPRKAVAVLHPRRNDFTLPAWTAHQYDDKDIWRRKNPERVVYGGTDRAMFAHLLEQSLIYIGER